MRPSDAMRFTFPQVCRLRVQASQRLRHARSEHGSAVVETALSFIVLLTMIFGILAISLALYTYNFISDAAREGTRYAIVRGSACQGFGSACPAASSDVQTYVKGLGFPGIDPSAMTVTPAWSVGPGQTSCTPSASCNNPGNLVKVTVQYQFPLAVPFLTARTLSLTSSSQMVISQ